VLAFAPDRPVLAVAGLEENAAQLWDLDVVDRRGPVYLPPQAQRVLALAYSPTGKVLASSSMDRTIDLWSVTGTRPRSLRQLIGHRQPVGTMVFSPDGTKLASAGEDQTVRIWNLATGQQEQEMPGLRVQALAFSPDGRTLACGGGTQTGEIRLLDVAQGRFTPKRVTFQRSHSRPVTGLAFLPDGEGLISASEDGQVILHGPSSGQPLNAWRFPGAVRGVALAVDGRHVATANANGTVYILRLRAFTGKS
jgi:WD40 repeat protein